MLHRADDVSIPSFYFLFTQHTPKNFIKPQLYAKTPYPCPFCCHIRHISANHKWWHHPTNARKISHAYPANPALRNALAGTSINQLATRADNPDQYDTHFSNEVPSRGITDQKSSGRCWLFTGLNVMRAKMIKQQGLGDFQFSQSYCFFYDQLEKSNLFLQAVIDNAHKPMSDQLVDWLFKNPLSDGGTFAVLLT